MSLSKDFRWCVWRLLTDLSKDRDQPSFWWLLCFHIGSQAAVEV